MRAKGVRRFFSLDNCKGSRQNRMRGGGDESLQLALATGQPHKLELPPRVLASELLHLRGEVQQLQLAVPHGSAEALLLVMQLVGEAFDAE